MLAFSQTAVNAPPLLALPPNCVRGRFLRRHKRFSVEIELAGKTVWAHCNNTGAMTGLLRSGAPVLLSPALNEKRKLKYTLERVWVGAPGDGFWAGVNTTHPNKILEAAFHAGALDFAKVYPAMVREKVWGACRFDACFTGPDLPRLWVECKNVTLVEDGIAAFPDAPSLRARKHLLDLMEIVKKGERAAMFYFVQRPDGKCFAPADYIDPEYAALFYQALAAGVEAHAFAAILHENGAGLGARLKIHYPS